MKKKQELKNGFSRTEMILASGIQKINAQNYGIFLTGKKIMENTLEFFQLAIGLKWTSGNTLKKKTLQYQTCT